MSNKVTLFMAEYKELLENIRQRERFAESTLHYCLVALGAAGTFLLTAVEQKKLWHPTLSLFLALLFLLLFLHFLRQEFEIMWFAMCIEHYIHPKIVSNGKRVFEWEHFRVKKRLDALKHKNISMLLIEIKPGTSLSIGLFTCAFLGYAAYSWHENLRSMNAWQHASAAILAALVIAFSSMIICIGMRLIKMSTQITNKVHPRD